MNRKVRLLIPGLLCVLALAPAGGVLARPADGGVQKTVLRNGLVVLTKEVHAAPIVSSFIIYRVGSRNEALGLSGKSHFLEHMLFKGTDRYRKGEIDLITLRKGGANNAFTSKDFTGYFFNFASDRWQAALEIESNRMTNNTFAPEEFVPEKQVVIEELKINLDSPWGALRQEVWATTFKAHPYRNPVVGWLQDVEHATAADMEAYYRRFYQPNNAILVLVGDFATEATLARVRELFEAIPRGPEPPPVRIVEPPQQGEKRVVVKKTTNLERLLMVFHAPAIAHPDSYALRVVATLLSQGKTSRLYQRLVEKEQAVTFAEASFEEAKDPTLFSISAELRPGYQLENVERAILEEIARLQAEVVSEAELEKAKNLMAAEFILQNETTLSQAIRLGVAEALLDHAYLDTYLERIGQVTPADVQRVAQTYLVADNRTVGWLVSAESPAAPVEARALSVPVPPEVETWVANAARDRFGRLRRVAEKKKTAKAVTEAAPLQFEMRPGLVGERRVLANGLTLLLAENHNVPAVALAAVVKAGSRYEPDAQAGLAVLTGRLLAEGTTTRSALEIATAIESVGGSLSSSAGYEASFVTATVLKKDFVLGVELVRDLLLNPTFPEERVAQERARQVAEIKSAQDRPRTVASWTFNELVFAGHPRHRPPLGYAETVSQLTRNDLVSFHQRYFAPNNTLLAVVGDISTEEALQKLEAAFGPWEPRKVAPPRLPALHRQEKLLSKYIFMDKEQVNVYLGHLGIARANPDYYALEVMDTILGGGPGFTSRIPGHLRDEQGLAYSTFSDITGSAGLDPGRFIAYIGTSPENLQQAIDGLVREIDIIVRERVTQTELEDAQAYLTGSFVFNFDTNSEIARFLLDAELYDLGFDYIEQYPWRIRSITVEDVARVAKRYLDPENYTLVVVGPVNAESQPPTTPKAGPVAKPR